MQVELAQTPFGQLLEEQLESDDLSECPAVFFQSCTVSSGNIDGLLDSMFTELMQIAIVGAGPAGTWASILLARRGHSVTLIDSQAPWEKPCGGGVTRKLFPASASSNRTSHETTSIGSLSISATSTPSPLLRKNRLPSFPGRNSEDIF